MCLHQMKTHPLHANGSLASLDRIFLVKRMPYSKNVFLPLFARECQQCAVNNGTSPHCKGCGNRRSLLESKSDYIRATMQHGHTMPAGHSPRELLVLEGRAPRFSMPALIDNPAASTPSPNATSRRTSSIASIDTMTSAGKMWTCQTCEAENSYMKIRCRECGQVSLGGTKRPESAIPAF